MKIINNYECLKPHSTEEIAGNFGSLDINYDDLSSDEIFPSQEINDYLSDRIYLPQEMGKKVDPFAFNESHMTSEQSKYLKSIIFDHKESVSTPERPLGEFKLFQASINFFTT